MARKLIDRSILKYGSARSLRQRMTDAERRIWYRLRSGRFLGHKFRRQHPIGPYVADFVCLQKMVIVEIDGGQHNEIDPAEQARTEFLIKEGFEIIRYWNHEVLENTEGVLEDLARKLGEIKE